jgi:hypothetical protein
VLFARPKQAKKQKCNLAILHGIVAGCHFLFFCRLCGCFLVAKASYAGIFFNYSYSVDLV